MNINGLDRFQGKVITEDSEGRMVLETMLQSKYNPYNVGKRESSADKRREHVKTINFNSGAKTAPNEKAWKWSMGYNALVGQYAPGSTYPELSGSSINRKKHAEKFPSTDLDIALLAIKTAAQYKHAGVGLVVEWEGRRSEHVSTIVERIYCELVDGNTDVARGLALRFSASFRGRPRGVSYGVHLLSSRSRGKIRDKATAFYRACAGARVFATFTFIAPVDDQTGITILNKFLTQLRKVMDNLNYFWVAERQENGNIHFHMILNKRLPICRWNAMWTLAQYNAGLNGKTEDGKDISKEEFIAAYKVDQAAGWPRSSKWKKTATQALLNPVDVKKIETITKLANYLTAYITKQDKAMRFGCLPWHCSRRVSKMFIRQTVGPSAFAYMKSVKNYKMDKSTGELFKIPMEKRVGNGFAVVIWALDKSAPLSWMKRLEQVNKWILEGVEIEEAPKIDDEIYKRVICKN